MRVVVASHAGAAGRRSLAGKAERDTRLDIRGFIQWSYGLLGFRNIVYIDVALYIVVPHPFIMPLLVTSALGGGRASLRLTVFFMCVRVCLCVRAERGRS